MVSSSFLNSGYCLCELSHVLTVFEYVSSRSLGNGCLHSVVQGSGVNSPIHCSRDGFQSCRDPDQDGVVAEEE